MGARVRTLIFAKSGESFLGDRRKDVRDYVKQTSVVVYFLTFLFLYATTQIEIPPPLYYLLFAMILITIGLWVESDSKGKVKVFPRGQLRLAEVPLQVAGGFLFAGVFIIAMMALGTLVLEPGISIGAVLVELFPQIIIVGGVETLMLIVYIRVVYMGEFVYPIIFAFSHTRIAKLWTSGQFPVESFMFFVYAIAMGCVFLVIYFGRTLLPKQIASLCGAVSVATFHGATNVIVQYSDITGG